MFISPSAASLPSQSGSSSSRAWLWVLGVCLVVAAVVGVLVLRYRDSEDLLSDTLVPAPRQQASQAPLDQVGEPPVLAPDADGDGLSDEEETRLGTNPRSHDTDRDGISDREEVMILKTDPKAPNASPFTHPLDREREQGTVTPPAVNP